MQNQSRFLQQRNELQRWHQSELGTPPADQRLGADHAPGVAVHLRLVIQHEFVLFQRLPQLVLERYLLGHPFGHLLRVEEVSLARGRFLECGFGVPEQGVGVVAVAREQGHAGPGRDPELGAGHGIGVSIDAPASLFQSPDEAFLVPQVGNHHCEVIGTHARHTVWILGQLQQAPDHLLEEHVAELPSKCIVDGLEPLDVDDDECELMLLAACRAHVFRQPLEEQRAVGEAGKRIVVSQVSDLFFAFDVLEAERDIGCEFGQQAHFFAVEEPELAGVQGKNADRRAADYER